MRLIDYYATWCGPCKKMEPVLDALAAEMPDLEIVKVDVDANPEWAAKAQVVSIPTYVLETDTGEQVARVTGALPLAVLKSKLGLS